jgi:hypothetical protein
MVNMRRGLSVFVLCALGARAFAAGPRPDLVTPKTELAIRKGLAYLAKAQHKRGSWSGGTGYGASYEAAMTGLAGVALLSSGSTATRGPYSANIRKAIYWVLSQQNRATGLICSRAEESRSMYGHGFCTLFLAESLGETGSKKLEARMRVALQRAIKLTEGSQSDLGGWIYTPSQNSDEGSVTVTQVQALRACQNAGVQVNKAVIEKSFAYLQKAKCQDGGIAYSARMVRGGRGSSRPAITAAALTCLFSAGKYNHPLTRSTKAYCLKRYRTMLGGRGGGHFYYTHLYLGEAMYQVGGKTWEDYYPRIRDWLLKAQQSNGAWQGDSVGLVYGTSIALTILQLPYGYLPVVQR